MIKNILEKIALIADYSLNEELALYPKPGLVSYIDSGSHKDMNFHTFKSSIAALHIYWKMMAQFGANGAEFCHLQKIGIEAERKMLFATSGVNTHRGAIFIIGILIASLSYAFFKGSNILAIPEFIREKYGQDIKQHKLNLSSHGSIARKNYLPKSTLLDMAASGFETIFSKYLPSLIQCQIKVKNLAALQLFFEILSETEDTNLLYRGGKEGLIWAQNQARSFIKSGGVEQQNAFEKAIDIHRNFIHRNLSPGGCADILSATIFILEAKRQLWA